MIQVIYLLFFVALAVIMARFYKRQEAKLRVREEQMRQLVAVWPSPDGHRRRIETVLKSLNCQYEWMKKADGDESDDETVSFDYQGGHFRIRFNKQSPYITLQYLFTHEATLKELNLVRTVINNCNRRTENCLLLYTIDEESNTVDTHVINTLLLNEGNATEVLKRGLDECFIWQRQVDRGMKNLEDEASQEGSDPELTRAQRHHERQLLLEQEMAHQQGGSDLRSSHDEPLTLGTLLDRCLALKDLLPLRLTITRDGHTETSIDKDNLLSTPLSAVLVGKDGAWSATQGNMTLHYFDLRNPEHMRHLSVDFEQQTGNADTLYYRCTLSLIPHAPMPTSAIHDDDRMPRIISVVVGHELNPTNHQEKLRYLYKEAMAKLQAGDTDDLTDNERLLTSFSTPYYGQAALLGRLLYNEGRYLESVAQLENVYRGTQQLFGIMTKSMRGLFYSICHLIGACYMQLQQWEKACYYLEQTLPARQYEFVQAYINCLVNSGDFRALGQINTYLEDAHATIEEEHYDEESEEMISLARFTTFLYRRKAYVLAEQERYDEAEALLKKLIDEPGSNDFALKELAYIQRKKGQKKDEKGKHADDQVFNS